MKLCPKCQTEKPETHEFFAINNSKPSGLNCYCRDCNKITSRNHYLTNKKKRITDSNERRKKQKVVIRDYIKSLNPKCKTCGESELVCLDFHHVNPEEKEYEIGELIGVGASLNKVRSEIEKCCVLCSNCHRKFHAGLIVLK